MCEARASDRSSAALVLQLALSVHGQPLSFTSEVLHGFAGFGQTHALKTSQRQAYLWSEWTATTHGAPAETSADVVQVTEKCEVRIDNFGRLELAIRPDSRSRTATHRQQPLGGGSLCRGAQGSFGSSRSCSEAKRKINICCCRAFVATCFEKNGLVFFESAISLRPHVRRNMAHMFFGAS